MARKKKARFSLCIEPTLNKGKSFRVIFSVGRIVKATLATVPTQEHAQALVNECKSVMSQPTGALNNMIKALSMHPWLNSEKENIRLQAAKLWKAHT